MDKIQLLPDSVANQIAAGEVIQRPASVIKELVENSIDAGAHKIDVLVVDAGRTSIQVIDDGIGMSVTDARLSFERHATSKIRKAEDLFSLHTMGFRGEALPSIAAVAQVTLKTRQADSPVGTCLCIDGSKVKSQEPVSCPVGTNFLIENLFYNVPVRRRFLKSPSTELNNIITAFQRIALVYPEVTFTLRNGGQEYFNLRAANLHQRIVDTFNRKLKLNQHLLPMEVETSLCTIKGFVGKPESSSKKCTQQYFFVNGRYMKHPYFQKAVLSAYERLIPQGEQVPFFIYFTMRPEDIDVNIHPTKTEIKFQDEASIWGILKAAVREAVGKYSSITKIDFDTEGKPEIPVFDGKYDVQLPEGHDFNPDYSPFSGGSDSTSNEPVKSSSGSSTLRTSSLGSTKVPQDWQSLYDELYDTSPADPVQTQQPSLFADELSTLETTDLNLDFSDRSKHHLQYKGSYIITTVKSGIMVTDQERAHECILYERYMKQMDSQKHTSQKVLFPDTVQFSLDEMVVLPSILPEMELLGFDLTDLGSGTYAINGVPAGIDGINIPALVQDMVTSAVEQTSSIRENLFSSLAATMARNAAIPHGQYLSNDEMETIINDLIKCSNCKYTPNGDVVFTIIPHDKIF